MFSVARLSSARSPDHSLVQSGASALQSGSPEPFRDPLGIAGRGPLETGATGRTGSGGGSPAGGLGAVYLGQASCFLQQMKHGSFPAIALLSKKICCWASQPRLALA